MRHDEISMSVCVDRGDYWQKKYEALWKEYNELKAKLEMRRCIKCRMGLKSDEGE